MLMRFFEFLKAWRRGERRIAPAGVRGRVYERWGGEPGMSARTKLQAKMSTRVFRASEGAWYRRNPATKELEKE
mgnify:FL=1